MEQVIVVPPTYTGHPIDIPRKGRYNRSKVSFIEDVTYTGFEDKVENYTTYHDVLNPDYIPPAPWWKFWAPIDLRPKWIIEERTAQRPVAYPVTIGKGTKITFDNGLSLYTLDIGS